MYYKLGICKQLFNYNFYIVFHFSILFKTDKIQFPGFEGIFKAV